MPRARRAALTHGFADRSRTWMLPSADYAAAGDTASALAALDSAALRPMTDDERAGLTSLRSSLDLDGRLP